MLVLVLAPACDRARRLPEAAVQALYGADHIHVSASNRQLRAVVEPYRVRMAAERFARFQVGWRHEVRPPVPELLIHFKKEGDIIAQYGIGHGFLTAGPAQSWVLPLAESDRDALLRLFAIKEILPDHAF